MIKEAFERMITQCCIKFKKNTAITVNGKVVIANKDISIKNNEVWIDGVKVEEQEQFDITNSCDVHISIVGDTGAIDTNGSVVVNGDVKGNIDAGEFIEVNGNVEGAVDAGDGVEIKGNVKGSIESGADIIVHGDAIGDLDACDNITIKGNHSIGRIDAGDGVFIGSAK